MRKLLTVLLVALFALRCDMAKADDNTQREALSALQGAVQQAQSSLPRDYGNGMVWDKEAIEGKDFIFYYTIDSNRAAMSNLKFDEASVKKLLLAALLQSLDNMLFYQTVANAGLNVAYAYRIGANSKYTIARFTNAELKDFFLGNCSFEPKDILEALAEMYKLQTPTQIEEGLIFASAEYKDDKFVMYMAVSDLQTLRNIEANKQAMRANIQTNLASAGLSTLCSSIFSAKSYLVYYYYCPGQTNSVILSWSPDDLLEVLPLSFIRSNMMSRADSYLRANGYKSEPQQFGYVCGTKKNEQLTIINNRYGEIMVGDEILSEGANLDNLILQKLTPQTKCVILYADCSSTQSETACLEIYRALNRIVRYPTTNFFVVEFASSQNLLTVGLNTRQDSTFSLMPPPPPPPPSPDIIEGLQVVEDE